MDCERGDDNPICEAHRFTAAVSAGPEEFHARIAREMTGVGVNPSLRCSTTSTWVRREHFKRGPLGRTAKSRGVSFPRKGGLYAPRPGPILTDCLVMASTCASVKVPSKEGPAMTARPEAHALSRILRRLGACS